MDMTISITIPLRPEQDAAAVAATTTRRIQEVIADQQGVVTGVDWDR